ncbi:hypothetical protein PFICI_08378 [Pestalotiopsis fici W106-1]|uniref:Uncharacterized protein n=1 Tax=Pestalotiopsis fici (strain W106-1 / CGMCC3.15140) TaxID=1229662 RepID=W3X4B6_PESFW|nr:uncharacterized protein PFICI_08378 [Pestalotiopsis fici W106-1]ETS80849.1 hypothetical protein PFICI_08378 [Pestalotiopsis fici W106-1]
MGVELPRMVTEHPSIVACEEAMVDTIFLCVAKKLCRRRSKLTGLHSHNDLLSVRNDLKNGVEHNIVIRLCDVGLTMQEAVDRVGEMLQGCFEKWHTSRAQIPSWDGLIDQNVHKLLNVYRDLALGSLYWSYETGRYVIPGNEKGEKVEVLMFPPAERH